jgi:chromosome segregation ATPase
VSEQYYTQEDVLKDTPAQVVENFEAQSNSLANVVPEVALALQQTGEALGELWNQAQEAGNTGAMALISAAWQRTEMIANQTVQIDALKQSAAVAIATIEDERKRVTEQLDELETAIYHVDDTHPQIKELVETIREDVSEQIQDDANDMALEYAFEVTYEQAMENVREATGCTWQQINRFLAFFEGDYDLSDETAAMLKATIGSMEEKSGGR